MAQRPSEQGQGEGGVEAGGRGAVRPDATIEFILVDTDTPYTPGARLRGRRGRGFVMNGHASIIPRAGHHWRGAIDARRRALAVLAGIAVSPHDMREANRDMCTNLGVAHIPDHSPRRPLE
jgi:hypothetical protein